MNGFFTCFLRPIEPKSYTFPICGMQPASFPCRHLSLVCSAAAWSCNFSENLVQSWAEHTSDGSNLRGSLLKKLFLNFLNVNSSSLLIWVIFFSPDILRTSKNYLPKICNTPSKSCSRLSCICRTQKKTSWVKFTVEVWPDPEMW